MKLTPKFRANAAAIIALIPWMVVEIFYWDRLSDSATLYVVVSSFVVGGLVYQWVLHRYSSRASAPLLLKPELNLVAEPLPRVVWLGAVPPVLAALMLWWVTVYGSELPWRDSWLAPPTPAVTHDGYRMMVLSVVVWNSWSLLNFVVALAVWHGMSRAYEFRRSMLLISVANQWSLFIGITAWVWGMDFRLPFALAVLLALTYAASLCTVLWNASRYRDLFAASPRPGTWFYRDSGDPAFLGPRGINIASTWCWVVAAAGIAPVVLVQWILFRTPA